LYSGVPGACLFNKVTNTSSSAKRADVHAMAAKPVRTKREATIAIDYTDLETKVDVEKLFKIVDTGTKVRSK
jgi:hypothetical protein